jgi:hypothetical protein
LYNFYFRKSIRFRFDTVVVNGVGKSGNCSYKTRHSKSIGYKSTSWKSIGLLLEIASTFSIRKSVWLNPHRSLVPLSTNFLNSVPVIMQQYRGTVGQVGKK